MNASSFSDYLIKNGFQTGKTYFPGFRIIENLPHDTFFRNDGVVEDIGEQTKKIERELNVKYDFKLPADNSGGRFLAFEGRGEDFVAKGAIVYILSGGNKYASTFAYGHEVSHAWINLGLKEYLLKTIRDSGFLLDPFKKYGLDDEESIANVGGWVALERLESPIEKIFITDLELIRYRSDLVESRIR